ncbi:MAG: hypothetical protein IT285_13045 [Bdellovibrionales bacterium]|nr:hypothetical protein [Bdellovibrionales bacterium]
MRPGTAIFALNLVAALAAGGCSSVKVKPERAQAVATAAVVGYTVIVDPGDSAPEEAYDPETGRWKSVLAASAKGAKAEAAEVLPEERRELQAIYAAFGEGLARELKWSVVPAADLKRSAELRQRLAFRVGSVWSPPDVAPDQAHLLPEVLAYEESDQMGGEQRERMRKELGVDALVFLRVRVSLDIADAISFSRILGIGAAYPVATVEVRTFGAGDEEAIWFDPGARGDLEDPEGTIQVAGRADREAVLSKALQAFRASFRVLIRRYRAEIE